MSKKQFSALSVASLRGMESYYPENERLFYDRISIHLMPPLWKVFLKLMRISFLRKLIFSKREKQMPGVIGNLLYRTRYIDDILKKNIEQGVKQILILGAGFDTRAYRIKGKDVDYFEVDHPEICDLKEKQLEKVFSRVPDIVSLISIDFDKQDLKKVIKHSGFMKNKKTLVIWEGVTQYISKQAVANVLNFVKSFKSGSRMVFTYIKKDIIERKSLSKIDQKVLSFTDKIGTPWIFGINHRQIEKYLKEKGYKLIEDVGAEEYKEKYPFSKKRNLNIYYGERVAYAEVF